MIITLEECKSRAFAAKISFLRSSCNKVLDKYVAHNTEVVLSKIFGSSGIFVEGFGS